MKARIAGLDVLRLTAVAAVVAQHSTALLLASHPEPWVRFANGLTYWAVPALFVLSGWLAAGSAGDAAWLARRAKRLLVPYAAWTVVYVALTMALAKAGPASAPSLDSIEIVFTGGAALILWFLPAMLYVTVLVWAWPARARWLLLAACLGLWLAFETAPPLMLRAFTDPLLFARRIPYLAVAYMIGAELRVRWRPALSRFAPAIAVISMAAGATVVATRGQAAALSLDVAALLCAAALTVVAAHTAVPQLGGSARLVADSTLGVYVVHWLVLQTAVPLLPTMLPAPVWLAMTFATALGLSLVVVLLARRVPVLRPAL